MTRHIAMWSGPRNLSTAMMRSFGSRADCHVMDEPFYAAYLSATGIEHPMCEEVIAAGETDPEAVVRACLADAPPPAVLSYQKHMTHHMIDSFPIEWLTKVTNVFLIREPERVLASYGAKREEVSAADIGFERQRELFDEVHGQSGRLPVVIDAGDIRANPAVMLNRLCAAISIPFDPAMLSWEAGPKPEDGAWAPHWYDAVWKSTGFAPPEPGPLPKLAPELVTIAEAVRPHYEHLARHKL